MGMQKVPNYERLYKRGNTYQYRFLIPEELRGFFGGKSEIKKSLRTDSQKEAIGRWAIECERTNTLIAEAKHAISNKASVARVPTSAEAWSLVRDWHESRLQAQKKVAALIAPEDIEERIRHEKEHRDAFVLFGRGRKMHAMTHEVMNFLCEREGLQVPEPETEIFNLMADLIHRARIDTGNRVIAFLSGDMNDHPEGIDRVFLSPPTVEPELNSVNLGSKTPCVRLAQAIDEYASDPARSVADSTRRSNRDKLSFLVRYFGAEADLSAITSDQFAEWTRLLLRLPPNASKRFPDDTLKDIVAAGERAGLAPMSRSNVRVIQQTASTFIESLVKRERLDRNRLRSQIIEKSKFNEPSRRPFAVAELNTLFQQPLYSGCKDDERGFATPGTNHPRRGRFWLPLIGLFTGMRMAEIAQLWTDDIVQEDGVWLIWVRFDAGRGKTLKNQGSERKVPIHKELIDIGFVDWVKHRRSAEPCRLFPDIPKAKSKDDYSSVFSKRFAKFLEKAGLSGSDLTFHSLRHNFRDAIREADLSDGIAKALGGWEDNEAHSHYGRGYKITQLKTAIDAIEYRDGRERLRLSHLKRHQ